MLKFKKKSSNMLLIQKELISWIALVSWDKLLGEVLVVSNLYFKRTWSLGLLLHLEASCLERS